MAEYNQETIRFLSADGKTQAAGYFYTPVQGTPRAVIQLSHGMCEYIHRYASMIETLTGAGIAVCGNDHLGHGDTSPEHLGFFAAKDGYRMVLKDLYTMNQRAHERYPGIPCFLMGHSMGSFYARWYGEGNPDTIDGLIISGTGGPNPAIGMGKTLSALMAKIKGPEYVSRLMMNLSNGGYGKKFPEDDPNCWLSRDNTVWAAYAADPKCSFCFTVSAYRDMLTAYQHVNRKSWAQRMRKELPILIWSGEDDPVGNFGKGVRAVYQMLLEAGVQDVTLKLYPGGRHEMHNEINREDALADLIGWVDGQLGA